jgi:small subunit ribosomal protein S8
MVEREAVNIPLSRIKVGIAEVLKKEGFIKDFKNIPDNKQGILRIYLKYGPLNQKIINHIKRESKPGRRIYKQVEDIGKVLNGIGISIYSTSKGILSNKECRENKIGGEHICTVW